MQTKQTILLALALLVSTIIFSQVGIGTIEPHASAILELKADSKGFLPPRLTDTQRDAISSPAAGLTIFNTTENCLQWYNGTGWFDGCDGSISGPLDPSTCDNDVSTSVGTGNLVAMQYNYSGVFGVADYTWCAYEITQATEDAYVAANPAGVTTGPAPLSGKTWLDRNLGAYQYATSSTDAASYGDLYQWGRAMDGHAKRRQRTGDPAEGSGTQGTMVNAITSVNVDVPTDALFITEDVSPFDWRENQENDLWSSTGGTNNPCPSGYYVPTVAQLETLHDWLDDETNRALRAIEDTELNMPMPGTRRSNSNGIFGSVGIRGDYWSSTVSSSNARGLLFSSVDSSVGAHNRAFGFAVRCLKD